MGSVLLRLGDSDCSVSLRFTSQKEVRSLLAPVVRGIRVGVRKVVLCGTSLSVDDVQPSVSAVAKAVGAFSLVVDELKPWTHDEFRTLLRNCLRDATTVAAYDLPDELFPGVWRLVLIVAAA